MRKFLRPGIGHKNFVYRTPDAVENATYLGGKLKDHMKNNYNPKDPLFRKSDEGRNVNNLWSGYELGGKGKIAVTGSLLLGGSIVASNPRVLEKDFVKEKSESLDIESLQSTRGDMQGYSPILSDTSALSTSGDLVFAMHKTRHSGQL